jgi:hypothetical protein
VGPTTLPATTVAKLQRGIEKVPEIAGKEIERAYRVILFTFWRRFRAQLPFRRQSGRFALNNPARWPITVEREPGTARVRGGIEGESDVLALHEFGGTLTARGGRFLAIPVGISLSRDGRRKKHHRSPADRTARGIRYVAFPSRSGALYLHELRPEARARRGRPRKNAGQIAMRPNPVPSWSLVRRTTHRPGYLGFYRTVETMQDQVRRSMEIAANATARKALGQGVGIIA